MSVQQHKLGQLLTDSAAKERPCFRTAVPCCAVRSSPLGTIEERHRPEGTARATRGSGSTLQTGALTLTFRCFSTKIQKPRLRLFKEGRGQPRIIAGIVASNGRFVRICPAIFTEVQWAFLLGATLWCLWKVASCH